MKYKGKDVKVKKKGEYTQFIYKDKIIKSFIDVGEKYSDSKKKNSKNKK